ncbi:MAG: DNA methyltransferase, partial [Candidatus Eremiobacterota bacterium]
MLNPNKHWPARSTDRRGRLLKRLKEVRSARAIALVQHHVADLSRQLEDLSDEQSRDVLRGELQQIQSSQTLERAHYYVDRLIRGLTEVRTPDVSDINLNRWKEYSDIHTDSLWIIPRRDSTGVHRADYWGNFVPQIPQQLMRRYTRPGEWVLDPFAGSGTTLVEAQRLGRNAVGVELRQDMVEHALRLVRGEPNPHGVRLEVVQGDSTCFDFAVLSESVQLAVLHPPYHDIIRFSDHPHDLSGCGSVEDFLDGLRRVVSGVDRVLDPGRYLGLVIGDKYHDGEWIPLGFLAMETIQALGYQLKSIVVKNFEDTAGKRNQKELWRYRALAGGFYVFKHEYVFVFRKR